jgi:hypothetical protein
MQKFNTFILNFTVSILDFLYKDLPYQRFWVLEEIARAPYFAFLSVLHLRESLGLRGPEHLYLMRQHFEQTLNETEHLEYMELHGGSDRWIDRFFAKHLVLLYFWIMVVYYFIDPINAYHLNSEVELHATMTYAKYLTIYPEDKEITKIMNDEVQHYQDLIAAMKMI